MPTLQDPTPSSETGSLAFLDDGGWILNHESNFELTVHGLDRAQAINLKKQLNAHYRGEYVRVGEWEQLLNADDFRCQEVDDYINSQRPAYQKALKQFEGDQERAAAQLDIRPPHVNLGNLFSEAPPSRRTLKELIATTYTASAYATQKQRHRESPPQIDREWQIRADSDVCPLCQKAASKTYNLQELPRLPLHIGGCGLGIFIARQT